MIKSIPAVWDETIVLPMSDIGELAAFARRSGDVWFLTVLNEPDAKTIKVPLSFLGRGEYRAMLVRDRKEEAATVEMEKITTRRSDSLTIELNSGGGFIARFQKN